VISISGYYPLRHRIFAVIIATSAPRSCWPISVLAIYGPAAAGAAGLSKTPGITWPVYLDSQYFDHRGDGGAGDLHYWSRETLLARTAATSQDRKWTRARISVSAIS